MRAKMPGLKADFLWNNYNGAKEVLDIRRHSEGFVKKLPVKAVIFPNIGGAGTAVSIEPVNKGKAVTQMIHSTVAQMGGGRDPQYLKMLLSFVSGLDFYQINLSHNPAENAEALKKFITERL
jgi:hypothetical protein